MDGELWLGLIFTYLLLDRVDIAQISHSCLHSLGLAVVQPELVFE